MNTERKMVKAFHVTILLLAIFSAAVTVGAAVPTVITLAPGVSATTALLFGQVNPNGKPTLWSLSYALAGHPLAAACSGDISTSLSALHTISCSVTGLTPSTNYHVQANALNADGSAHGADLTFTTVAASTTAGGRPIVSSGLPIVETTSATLLGSVNPNALPTTYWFQYKEGPFTSFADGTTVCDGSLPAGTTPVSVRCTLSGLEPSTTYYYSLFARNAAVGEGLPVYSEARSFTTRAASTTTGAPQSDWTIISTSTNPPSPHLGDAVKFSMTISLLSTNAPLPQLVHVQCLIDGVLCGEGTITYSAGVGGQHQVNTEAPWMATEGIHTVAWTVSSDNDPNPSNNSVSQTFTVPSAGTQTQTSTTQTEATSTAQTTSQETTQIQSSTTQPATEITQTTQQQTSPVTVTVTSELTSGLMDIIQQNSLLFIGALALLVVILTLALRTRRPASTAPETGLKKALRTGGASPNVFCPSCGTANPSTSQFCAKCGSRLI